MSSNEGSTKVVLTALAGNGAIALTKYVAAFISGSSSMLSEAIHSTVDTTNQLLLLYGMKRAKRPAGPDAPLGNGREIYFWSFIVALMIFALGAAISGYEGVMHILHPKESGSQIMSYIVLGIAFIFEFISWRVALKDMKKKYPDQPLIKAARRSKDPTTFIVLFEDSAALLGIVIAAGSIALAQYTGDPRWDGVGSVLIALLLGATALFLARETKGLLMGERALPEVEERIRDIIGQADAVQRIEGIQTLQLGPGEVMLAANIAFRDELSVPEMEQSVAEIETRLKHADDLGSNKITAVMIKPLDSKG